MKDLGSISVEVIMTLVGMAFAGTVFAYSTFLTKEEADLRAKYRDQQMTRMEKKLNRALGLAENDGIDE